MKKAEIAVIGAGPGGIAAAVEAAGAGATPVVLDENVTPGGRIYWQFNEGFSVTDGSMLGSDYARGRKLLSEFSEFQDRIGYLDNAVVYGLFEDRRIGYHRDDAGLELGWDRLIVAPGAYDRPVPFPGWTLPGVFTAGGAQSLVKMQQVLPGERILLAGTGPLQLVLAHQIISLGGTVVAIAEAGDVPGHIISLARGAWGNWGLMADALTYMRSVRKARTPVLRRHMIVEARGADRVEEAVVAEVDEHWRPVEGTERTFRVDAVCVGYGFIPSVELTRMTGCTHSYSPALGGWIPVRTHHMETDVEGVYAVGDGAGVGGSIVALQEGRIAGISAARSLGYLSDDEARRRRRPFEARLRCLNRLRSALDRISMPRPGLFELADDDTTICRCEEVTVGDIRRVIADGVTEINEIKRLTRMGMGRCQGRMCAPAVQELIARDTAAEPASVGCLHQRSPVKPVPLRVLAR